MKLRMRYRNKKPMKLGEAELHPNHWYSVDITKMSNDKVSFSVLGHEEYWSVDLFCKCFKQQNLSA